MAHRQGWLAHECKEGGCDGIFLIVVLIEEIIAAREVIILLVAAVVSREASVCRADPLELVLGFRLTFCILVRVPSEHDSTCKLAHACKAKHPARSLLPPNTTGSQCSLAQACPTEGLQGLSSGCDLANNATLRLQPMQRTLQV